ncbi:MAG: hypothetical protein R2845_00025 [Thermomicrobiales bacterium]
MPPSDVAGRFVLAVLTMSVRSRRLPAPAASFYPIDASVDPVYAGVLERAFGPYAPPMKAPACSMCWVENDVPVFVEEIEYNGIYGTRWTRFEAG